LLEQGLAGKLEDRQYDMVKRMRRATTSALSMLEDLLVQSQAQAGTLSIQKRMVDLAPLLEEVVAEHKWQADQSGLDLQLRLPAASLTVSTDPTRVRRILGNLLSNAIKFTLPPGNVVVSAGVRTSVSAPQAGPRLAVEVRDSGPGIPEDEREKIFEEFYRIGDTAQSVKGFGIGLPTSRRVARLLGGDITIESQPGKGAVFMLCLPVSEEDQTEVRSAAD
jgi:signal transduction histidine kinase